MKKLSLAALVLLATPAFGLELNNTMTEWKAASAEDRMALLGDVAAGLKTRTARQRVYACMNQATNSKALVEKTVLETIALCGQSRD